MSLTHLNAIAGMAVGDGKVMGYKNISTIQLKLVFIDRPGNVLKRLYQMRQQCS